MAVWHTEYASLVDPNLWMPGHKPTGPMVIDRDHPLTERCVFYALTNTGEPGVINNMIDNALYKEFTPAYLHRGSNHGEGIYALAGPARFEIGPQPGINNHDYTVMVQLEFPLTRAAWNTIFQSQGGHHHLIFNSAHNVGVFYGGFFNSGFDTDTLTPGAHTVVAVGFNNTTRFFIDGRFVGQSNRSIDANPNTEVTRLFNSSGGNQQIADPILMTALFDKAMTDARAAELSIDPYQLIKPA